MPTRSSSRDEGWKSLPGNREAVGVTLGVGVSLGVVETVRVTLGVAELLGVIDGVGDGVGVPLGDSVDEALAVDVEDGEAPVESEGVGVLLGVSVRLGEREAVVDGVGAGKREAVVVGVGVCDAAVAASGAVRLTVYQVPDWATTTWAKKVTGPDPAAGAIHVPAATLLSAPLVCVRPKQSFCTRVPEPATKEPAFALAMETKEEPKKAFIWKPRKVPPCSAKP